MNNQISASERLERLNAARLRKLNSTTVTVEVAEGKYKDFDKEAVLKTFSVMDVLDDETRFDVAYHISCNFPLKTDEAKSAIARMGYQRNKHPDNLAMKEVVDACMQMTLDTNEIIFNGVMFLKELEPEEHDMMRRRIFKRKDYLEAVAREMAQETRVAESIKTANKTPAKGSVYTGGNELIDRMLTADDGVILHPMLLDGFAEAGISNPKNVEAYLEGARNPTKGEVRSKIAFMDFNQPGADKRGDDVAALTQSFAGKDRPKPELKVVPFSPKTAGPAIAEEITTAMTFALSSRVVKDGDDRLFTDPADVSMLEALAYQIETAPKPGIEP